MENEKKYNVRVEVDFLFDIPVTALDEDEAGDIASSLVWDQIPEELVDECVNCGSKSIEVWEE